MIRRLYLRLFGRRVPVLWVTVAVLTPACERVNWGFTFTGHPESLAGHMPGVGSKVFLYKHGWSTVIGWTVEISGETRVTPRFFLRQPLPAFGPA